MPLARSTQRPASASSVRKKTDEQLFEFLNSGPSSLGTAEKRAPQFTSTPVKQKPPQSFKQSDEVKAITQTAEESISIDKGLFFDLENCTMLQSLQFISSDLTCSLFYSLDFSDRCDGEQKFLLFCFEI